jgi:hypothetical protein
MPFVCRGHEYHCVIGSDVQRDGMYLEIAESLSGPEILEVFYSDHGSDVVHGL